MNNLIFFNTRVFLLFVIMNISSQIVGQKDMSQKEISKTLKLIEYYNNKQSYEEAINSFSTLDKKITNLKMSKKNLSLFSLLKEDVLSKKAQFDRNSLIINSWELLKDENKNEFLLKDFKQLDTIFLYNNDKKKMNELAMFLQEWSKKYSSILVLYIDNYKRYLNTGFSNPKDYSEACERLKEINKIILTFDQISYPDGDIPELIQNIEQSKSKILHVKNTIENFINENKPLSLIEIEQLINKTDIKASDIKKHANIINLKTAIIRMPDNTMKKVTMTELKAIIGNNVFMYFGLNKRYDSELKRSVFMDTEEYKSLQAELKQIREFVINSYFYLPLIVNCYEKYNTETKSFKYSTSSLDGFFYSTNYLQFEELCILKPNNFSYEEKKTFGGSNYYISQRYYVPIQNRSSALKIEENCQQTMQMFLFKFDKTVSAKNALGFNTIYLLATPNQYLIFNIESDEIYQRFYCK
jgi:hypothetical protein